MKVYGQWYGGGNYAAPPFPDSITRDFEVFPSIEAAENVLFSRYANADGSTPAVTRESEIFLYHPETVRLDPCRRSPFRRVYFGPRGGVRSEDL